MTRSIFVGGTASHVGKSWMTTAICRYLRRRGLRVAPFKAQNMSNNSYPLIGGGEIGRAQVVQAEACGLEPESDMNPILLKPNSNTGSQVVLNGRVWKNLSGRDYYEHFDFLHRHVLDAFTRLSQRYEYIVIEGAGSVTEMNLKARDLVNLRLARDVGSPALIVADIDRGGVFASLTGTMCLLDEDERSLIRSFAVNRFRGDPGLFVNGVRMIEQRMDRPCLGVFPMLESATIDAEDGVWLEGARQTGARQTGSRIAAMCFPRISNLTDLQRLPDVDWLRTPNRRLYDFVVLPGTKNTIADLRWLRQQGLFEWIVRQHAAGAQVIGVCGGYQMLGSSISDPEEGTEQGLGLLPISTVIEAEKVTERVEAWLPSGVQFSAYEIHMGRTSLPPDHTPFAHSASGSEGIRANRCIGTYLHGALECTAVATELFGVAVPEAQSKDAAYEGLADWFGSHANIRLFEDAYL